MSGDTVRVSDVLPTDLCSVFPFDRFNPMQSIVCHQLLETNLNVVVAAPTGSGKTVLHELAILRFLCTHASDHKQLKCLVITPNKALCQQRAAHWSRTFRRLDLATAELTGDSSMTTFLQTMARSNIIITTPEKWDSVTRSWRKHMYLLGAVNLLLLDEIHHLGEDRGAVLETVVVRLRILNETVYSGAGGAASDGAPTETGVSRHAMRIVALSATLPNVSDVGEWLQCGPAAVHYFDDSFRPVPLSVHVKAYPAWSNPFLFERGLDSKVADVVRAFSDDKQTLIFCSSKKGTESLCQVLSKQIRVSGARDSRVHALSDPKLRHLVEIGIGYHHAGLPPDDRAVIETLFLEGGIQILCTTTTLAHGVNLPAHLVVVKGTQIWRGKGYEKLPRSTILQMIGRAGRPSFDTSGVAVIMTSEDDRAYYEVPQMDVVESALQSCLVEALCVEITQGVIRDVSDVLVWLKMTFFYIRVLKNSQHYGVAFAGDQSAASVVQGICMRAINDLASASIIDYDPVTFLLSPRREATIMTMHVVRFESMKMMMAMDRNWGLAELVRGICFVEEAVKPLRRDEKKALNEMMKKVRFPLKTRVSTPALKAFVLVQTAVSRIFIVDYSLRFEQADIVDQLMRVLRALREHCVDSGKGKLLESCVLLRRALALRRWENGCANYFEQFNDISSNLLATLSSYHTSKDDGVSSIAFSDIACTTVNDIQRKYLCSADDAKSLLRRVGEAKLSTFSVRAELRGGSLVLLVSPIDQMQQPSGCPPLAEEVVLVAYDFSNGGLICYRELRPMDRYDICVALPENCVSIRVHICFGGVVGLDVDETFHVVDGSLQPEAKMVTQMTIDGKDKKQKKTVRDMCSETGKAKKKKQKNAAVINVDEDGYHFINNCDYMITGRTCSPSLGASQKENDSAAYNQTHADSSVPRELKSLRRRAQAQTELNNINVERTGFENFTVPYTPSTDSSAEREQTKTFISPPQPIPFFDSQIGQVSTDIVGQRSPDHSFAVARRRDISKPATSSYTPLETFYRPSAVISSSQTIGPSRPGWKKHSTADAVFPSKIVVGRCRSPIAKPVKDCSTSSSRFDDAFF